MMLVQQHFALFLLTFELIQSAQRESNPRFRHGKTAGYRYITGAYQQTLSTLNSQQWKRWESNPRTPA